MALIKNKIFIGRLILSGICSLFLATTFHTENRSSGWYQQFFPNLNGSSINSITFLDSLTGFAVTSLNLDTNCYILRTTNGGDNWSIIYTYHPIATTLAFNKIQFADNNIGYAIANYTSIFKTTNGGANWDSIYTGLYPQDMSVVNKDTLLCVYNSILSGGVWRSTNGGYNWQALGQIGGNGQPNKIYMFDKNIGFSDDNSVGSRFKKTTNGGLNWIQLSLGERFYDIKFIDSLKGWKCSGAVKKTTDGGFTWISQQLPPLLGNSMIQLSVPSINEIWGVGGFTNPYGVMFKSTNEGTNWGYQVADTSVHIGVYFFINFIDRKSGWAYTYNGNNNTGVHTKVGGNDTTFFTGLTLYSNIVPEKFSIGQNYPNPFNPTTKIPYELKEPSYVTLKVYDITGRMVKELVNGNWGTAKYIADFDASGLSSGIYFYRIEITGESTKEKFIDSKKMVMIK